MRLLHLRRTLLHCVAGFGLLASMASAQGQSNFAKQIKSSACPNDDSALRLPPGFCATVFADGIGHARHLVVSAGGLVYVNTWSSPYYGRGVPHPGGFLVVLQDRNGAGKADVIERFGETEPPPGSKCTSDSRARALRRRFEQLCVAVFGALMTGVFQESSGSGTRPVFGVGLAVAMWFDSPRNERDAAHVYLGTSPQD